MTEAGNKKVVLKIEKGIPSMYYQTAMRLYSLISQNIVFSYYLIFFYSGAHLVISVEISEIRCTRLSKATDGLLIFIYLKILFE